MQKVPAQLCAALLACGFIAAGESKAGEPLKKIGAAEAAMHYDKHVVVTGVVAKVTLRPKVVYLNIDEPFPNTPFTGVIFPRYTNQFDNLPALTGKHVEITGTIEEYRESPQIVLTNAAQLKVIEKAGTNPPPKSP